MTVKKTEAPAAIARVSRVVFKLGATVPTGNYQNLTPSMEIEFIIPEGATVPNSFEEMGRLRSHIATSLIPYVAEQTNLIPLYVKQIDGPESIDAAFMKGSPLFQWLSTFDRTATDMIVAARYEKFLHTVEMAEEQRKHAEILKTSFDTDGPH